MKPSRGTLKGEIRGGPARLSLSRRAFECNYEASRGPKAQVIVLGCIGTLKKEKTEGKILKGQAAQRATSFLRRKR